MDEVAEYNEAAGDKKGQDLVIIPDFNKGVVGIIAGYLCGDVALYPDKASGNCTICRGINGIWPNWELTLDVHFGYYWETHDCVEWTEIYGADCHKWLRQRCKHAEWLRVQKKRVPYVLSEFDDSMTSCSCGCLDD